MKTTRKSPQTCRDKATQRRKWAQVNAGGGVSIAAGRDASVTIGDFFILGGQKAYVAEKGKVEINANGNSEDGLGELTVVGTCFLRGPPGAQ